MASEIDGKRLINNRWLVKGPIDAGSFGVVKLAVDIYTKEEVAAKFFKTSPETERNPSLLSTSPSSPVSSASSASYPSTTLPPLSISSSVSSLIASQECPTLSNMEMEVEAYKIVHSGGPAFGIPGILYHGRYCEDFEVFVMPRLGENLEICRAMQPSNKLPVGAVLNIGWQILQRLECIHMRGLLHMDIKPDNILLGLADPNVVYLLDFGLSRLCIDLDTGEHIENNIEGIHGFCGTLSYASVRAHKKWTVSRRDELESLFYVLVYLLKGTLPWSHIEELRKVDESDSEMANGNSKSVVEMQHFLTLGYKSSIGLCDLCIGLPKVFRDFADHISSLRFEDVPSYSYLRSLFDRELQQLSEDQRVPLSSLVS